MKIWKHRGRSQQTDEELAEEPPALICNLQLLGR